MFRETFIAVVVFALCALSAAERSADGREARQTSQQQSHVEASIPSPVQCVAPEPPASS